MTTQGPTRKKSGALPFLAIVPLGMILYLMRGGGKRLTGRLWTPAIIGFCVSCMVEATQVFLPRSPSVIDVLTNTAGTVLGFELMRRGKIPEKIVGKTVQLWKRLSFRLVCAGIGVCAALTWGMSPYLLNAPVNWDEDYHLLIGNEATLDRPWQGQILRWGRMEKIIIGQPFGWYFFFLVLIMAFLGGVFGHLLQRHCNISE